MAKGSCFWTTHAVGVMNMVEVQDLWLEACTESLSTPKQTRLFQERLIWFELPERSLQFGASPNQTRLFQKGLFWFELPERSLWFEASPKHGCFKKGCSGFNFPRVPAELANEVVLV